MISRTRSIGELKQAFAAVETLADPLFEEFSTDSRKGVRQLIKQAQKRLKQEAIARETFQQRFYYENEARTRGRTVVAGMDEVGRGPLAGPVVTCAIVLPPDFDLIAVNDSKQLSDRKRESLYPQILNQAVAVSIGIATPAQIDTLNIYQATRVAMLETVNQLSIKPDQLLIDAMDIDSDIPQIKLIKGDSKSISIAAASIVAKVFRDHLMASYDRLYPGYEFAHNAGYGTRAHLEGLAKLGPTPIHRKTFEPVTSYLR